MLLASSPALAATDLHRERVEHNLRVLRAIDDCVEGYAATVEGSTLVYASYRNDPERALITRATSGDMPITWTARPVPPVPPGGAVSFVVMAGLYGQVPSGFSFHFSVNGVRRFTFLTTPEESWEVSGPEGGKLRFIAATRDKYRDLFGCLRFTIPGAWLKQGEPIQFSIVGEKAGQSAWCMVFEAPDVVAYHRELVQNEAYCDMSIRAAGGNSVLEFLGPSSWENLELVLASGRETLARLRFTGLDGAARAEVALARDRVAAPLTVTVGGDVLMRLDSLNTAMRTTLIYPRRLVSLSATQPGPAGWSLRYEATFHPGLGTSLNELARLSGGRGTQHLMVSTHQDIAWMDSPENCIREPAWGLRAATASRGRSMPNKAFNPVAAKRPARTILSMSRTRMASANDR